MGTDHTAMPPARRTRLASAIGGPGSSKCSITPRAYTAASAPSRIGK